MLQCILARVIMIIIVATHANQTTVVINPTTNTDIRIMFTNNAMCMTMIMTTAGAYPPLFCWRCAISMAAIGRINHRHDLCVPS